MSSSNIQTCDNSDTKKFVYNKRYFDKILPSYPNFFLSSNFSSGTDNAERKTHNQYKYLTENYLFIPISCETLGWMWLDILKLLNHLGKLIEKCLNSFCYKMCINVNSYI